MQELYLDHHPWLQSLLRKRLGNREDAADLAHDTFVRVMRSELSPTDLCEPRGFLATVARGLVADLFRRRTLEQAYLEYLVALPEEQAPSPEDQAQAQQALLEVDALLARLAHQGAAGVFAGAAGRAALCRNRPAPGHIAPHGEQLPDARHGALLPGLGLRG